MKKYILLFLVFIAVNCYSQSNINADCINAIPLCSTPNFTFNATSGVGSFTDIPNPSNISNPSINPASTNAGCLLSGELKPQWLLITVGNAGNLEFIFGAANSSNPQAGYYDWAMWPYTPATCANIQNNTLPPIRCNWNASSSGGTGIASVANQPNGSNAGNFEPPLAVLPCQQFIICISNFSGVNTLVSFQSLGTASLTCNPSCINVNQPTLCSGSTSSIVGSSSGNLTGITYSLNPGGLTSNTPTFVISPTVNTTYTLYATGLNSSSVAVTQTAVSNATVYQQPTATSTATQATCLNVTNSFSINLSFFPTAPIPGYTVTWNNFPTGVTSNTVLAHTGTIVPGVYSATITATGGCKSTTSFTIDPNPAPATISLTPAGPNYIVTCYDPTVCITAANASFNYTWTGISTPSVVAQTNCYTFLNGGNHTITAENPASGCIATKIISITINTVAPSAVISPTFQNITCNLTSITNVTATSNQSVNITHLFISPQGGTYSSNVNPSPYQPGSSGTFTHIVINDVNGCSTTRQFTLASNQGYPTFTVFSPQNYTLGCTTKSVANLSILNGATTPIGGPISYTFLPPGSSSVITSGTLSASNNINITIPGTWTVITKDNTSSCETRVPVSIISNTAGPTIDALVIPRQILTCETPSVILEASSITPSVSYNWAFPGIAGNLPSYSINVNANFTVASSNTLIANYTLTLTDENNKCRTTTIVPMYQNLYLPDARIANVGQLTINCKTQSLTLTNTSVTKIPANTFTNNGAVIGKRWDGPSPQQSLFNSSTYVALVPGVFTLIAKDSNNGCESTATINVVDDRNYPNVNEGTPVISILDCGSNTVVVAKSVPSVGVSYKWSPPAGASISNPTFSFATVQFPGVYDVLVTNTINGCATRTTATVKSNTILTTDFEPSVTYGFAPLEVKFTNNSFSANGSGSIASVWNYGNGKVSTAASTTIIPSTIFNSAGIYTVTLYTRKGDCLGTSTKTINVEIPSSLTIPNVFTPNGDGINDIFFLKTSNLNEISIIIYDRWGTKVYELISNKGNIAWDGKNQVDAEVPQGTYFYKLKAEGMDGQIFEKKGTITLIR